MSYFIKTGDKFKITSKKNLDLYESLPVGTYTVGADPNGFFLQTIEPFQLKGMIYGETASQSDRIMQTFMDRTASTGVLLAGEKGSGKTLLAKYISVEAAKEDIPTIVINKDWHGEPFNLFLQSITQPTVILFDEYEKVYPCDGQQQEMLTLLDGVYPSKKLFLLTCNDKWRVNSHMRNRPGRIFYLINFAGLSQAFITEYCQDNLIEKKHIGNICVYAHLFSAFNFDMLKALVEEMNRYGETPSESIKYLNTRPEFSSDKNYSVEVTVDGKRIPKEWGIELEWSGNPLLKPVTVYWQPPPPTDSSGHGQQHMPPVTKHFCPSDLNHLDTDSGKLLFKKGNAELVLKEKKSGYIVNFEKLTSSSAGGAVNSVSEVDEADQHDIVMSEHPYGIYQ